MANPGDDVYGSPEHLAFRETVRRFVQTELAPRAREFDQMGRIDKSLYRKMGELGLLGIRYDEQYGGQGRAARSRRADRLAGRNRGRADIGSRR